MARIYHTAHKRAKINNTVRNLLTALLIHQQVVVTKQYKIRVQQRFDRLITLAKKANLASYRRALNLVRKSQTTSQGDFLITELKNLARRYEKRPGGYLTSVILPSRRGDNATTYLLKLVA